MHEDIEACVRAVQSKDVRFDGWFFTAVTTTRIYCRPSCPVVPPKVAHMRFYPSAAAAQQAGYRACKRCRPDASPGSPEWDPRADTVARGMRLVADGVVDREGVRGLAARLGYSVRQVERLMTAELGAGPLALARAQRAQTARVLIETTDLAMGDVAFGAGFASIRSFNETVQMVFASAPTELRRRARSRPGSAGGGGAGWLSLRLAVRRPFYAGNLFGHLAATAVPGVEEWRDGAYWRTLRLPGGAGVVALAPGLDEGSRDPAGPPGADHVECRLRLADLRDLSTAIARCRRLLDLDADPVAIDGVLGADAVLGPAVREVPGRRVPRSVDGDEMAVRSVLGQQVSTAAARTHAARLVVAHAPRLDTPVGGLTHLWPASEDLRQIDRDRLALPRARRATLAALVDALASGSVDLRPGADWARARASLGAIPGVGPWAVETIAMRALGDPDAFVATDLGVRAAGARLGLPRRAELAAHAAAAWRPWRAYAVQHLWSTSDHAVNRIPA
ncbi:helix-turn-helix domain-containing protein [Acidiferrimicrobium sp. IK]|uniref:DNA-3-methyladenine glycosylase 2 family protein n=1 Tax=Acidiferrimicrobium sp. IK TaxID=2871700 RepID=UPI0021CB9898|nr:AlkA N-terminal domain-containing protein [Acidiferrimicrobium sp. IK]MCU4185303.1 helix-turn-helix domain-containing protein [Acidiferrimicrobium sp. IK]